MGMGNRKFTGNGVCGVTSWFLTSVKKKWKRIVRWQIYRNNP